MMKRKSSAFTLIEVLIVVVIMGILAATIIPQYLNSTDDAKTSSALYNLTTLRAQIMLYEAQHSGSLPSATLAELATTTNLKGQIGTGSDYDLGPYMASVPINPLTGKDTVTVISSREAKASDVTASGGWLYNPTTGGVWLDHADYYTE